MSTLCSTSLLHSLPQAVTPIVFEALDPYSRKNLYATSGDLQALFSPAVSRLKFRLAGGQQDQKILAGLHPRVQPKRLTIRPDYPSLWVDGEKEEYGAQVSLHGCAGLANCITTFASSPHSKRLKELRLKGFHLLVQPVPPPILQSLKVLVLKRVTVDAQALAAILSDCHQLEELQLVKTCLEGSSQPLAVLSNLPLVSLTLDVEETSLLESQQQLAVLQHLSPSLTTLDLHFSAAFCSPQTSSHRHELHVFRYIPSHLHGLKHLTISTVVHPYTDRRLVLSLAGAPVPQQLETLTLNCMELPDMQCAAALLSMPQLRLLAGDLWLSEDRYDTPATVEVPWPQGKPAMQLQIGRAGVQQLAALPLEHFSSIRITSLDLGSASGKPKGEDNRLRAFQALLAAARKCRSFSIANMCAGPGYPVLPALSECCPITLSNSSCLVCDGLGLTGTSVLGIAAAWGSHLKTLIFKWSALVSAAWLAITPAAFPRLEEIELVPGGSDFEWAPEVSVFCMEWPSDRQLQVTVTVIEGPSYDDHDNQSTASVSAQVQHMLRVRGKHNIFFVTKWEYES